MTKMIMSAIAMVTLRRLVPRVRVIVNVGALFPNALQLGDVTSVTDGHTI